MFESSGVKGISTETAIREIARITRSGPAQIGLIDLDWGTWGRVFTVSRDSSRFARLMPLSGEDGAQNLRAKASAVTKRHSVATWPIALPPKITLQLVTHATDRLDLTLVIGPCREGFA